MVGMPTVSDRARDLENMLDTSVGSGVDVAAARRAVDQLRQAFEVDLAGPVPAWRAPPDEALGKRVLVVEDDSDQLAILTASLRQAGYAVTGVGRGEDALPAAREVRPDVVLLDIDLPGVTGLDVCRELKADAALHETPVIFLTVRSAPRDRIAGLTLGADDYLIKPVEPGELLLRLDLVIRRHEHVGPAPETVLTYDVFLAAAGEILRRAPAALALVRLPRDRTVDAAGAIAMEIRHKDLLGRYDETHVLILLPDMAPAEAMLQMSALAASLAGKDMPIHVGLAPAAHGATFSSLLDLADEALAEARFRRQRVVLHGYEPTATAAAPLTIVIAEDDPDVMRVLDSRLVAAGYRTILAFDGQQALDAIVRNSPDLVVLDLMLPKLTGFEVLTELRRTGAPPTMIVVISARGREADITRAFALGAADYLTKPFGPQELLARLSRLQR